MLFKKKVTYEEFEKTYETVLRIVEGQEKRFEGLLKSYNAAWDEINKIRASQEFQIKDLNRNIEGYAHLVHILDTKLGILEKQISNFIVKEEPAITPEVVGIEDVT